MKIVLIYPPYRKLLVSHLDPPLSLVMVAETLRLEHDVSIVDLRVTDTVPAEADIYGFTASTPGYDEVLSVLADIKRTNPAAKTIIGGPHASALPHRCLQDGFDKVFVGECEVTLPDVMANWSKAPDIIPGELPATIPPYYLHNFVNTKDYMRSARKIYSLILARGCLFKCRYCATNRQYRTMTLADVVRTISSLGNMKGLRFYDDNFLLRYGWFKEVAQYLGAVGVPYFIFCRGEDLCDRVILTRLVDSGCRCVSVGFETASQEIHDTMKTAKNVAEMVRGMKLAARAGIDVRLNLIIGMPGETWDTIKHTVEVVNTIDFVSYSLNHFVAYPGTFYFHPDGNFQDYYFACGSDGGRCSVPQMDEWRQYMLDNILRPSHSKVSGKGLL